MMESRIWKEELRKVFQCNQRQDSLESQMQDLCLIANRFGFYDAADYIREQFITPYISDR